MSTFTELGQRPEFHINLILVKKQGLTEDEVLDILRWHEYRMSVFDIMEATDEPERLRHLAQVVEDIEFQLQKLWKFPQSRDYHTWWNRVPKCRCPRMDNQDYHGTPYRVISGACPVHHDPTVLAHAHCPEPENSHLHRQDIP